MPTIHYLTANELEILGREMTLLEHQIQKEIIEKNGKTPTRDEIHEYIKKETGSDASDDGDINHEETDAKSRSDSLSSLPKHIEKTPIFVKCGNKQELWDALELTGPGVKYKKGQVYVEWYTSGKKQFVPEADVIRGGLEPRRRKKTERFVDVSEEKPRRKTGVREDAHFLPINRESSDSEEELED